MLPLAFSPLFGWVQNVPQQAFSCHTKPAQATLTNNAHTEQAEKGPKTVSRSLSDGGTQARCLVGRNVIYFVLSQVRGLLPGTLHNHKKRSLSTNYPVARDLTPPNT